MHELVMQLFVMHVFVMHVFVMHVFVIHVFVMHVFVVQEFLSQRLIVEQPPQLAIMGCIIVWSHPQDEPKLESIMTGSGGAISVAAALSLREG